MFTRILSIFVVTWLCLLQSLQVCAAAGDISAVLTVDQPRFHARLSSVLANGSIQFTLADGITRNVRRNKLVRWGAAIDTKKGPQILLIDGSLLIADAIGEPVAIDGEVLRAELDLFDVGSLKQRQVELPLDLVRGVLFRIPSQANDRDRLLDELADPQRRTDVVILENGDKLEGAITSLDETSVKMQVDGTEPTIDMGRVTAIAMNGALARRPVKQDKQAKQSNKIIVSTADGGRFVAEKIEPAGNALHVRLRGVEAIPVTLSRIVGVQPIEGQVTYLSDMKPHSYVHLPLLEMKWPYFKDRSTVGTRLRSPGGVHHKGLGMHSTARLTYRLDKSYRRLEADLAIDQATAGGGSVVYRVMIDEGLNGGGRGKTKWKTVFTSSVVRGGDRPLPMSVDVSKAKRVSLVVDFAERGDVQDHANWLDARLVP